ncbi:Protein kinase domain-containing protein 19 [Elsinoe fawcettii]|nr:Protein kinase domain-containing protein 19 [Elsinoe fawcettii]
MSVTAPKSLLEEPSLSQAEWRFIDTCAPCEWAEQYRPGGFHPVNLDDTFQNRYRVIRKLGYGSYSTVWLAHDERQPRYVALKIMTAKSSGASTELDILQHLANAAKEDKRSDHIMGLLDTFVHEGPNGSHRCLVLEPMGPTAASMRETMPLKVVNDDEPKHSFQEVRRYPLWMTRRMIKNALQGLAFLHDNNVTHGDIQPGNILFPIQPLETIAEEELRQDEGVRHSVFKLERVDGLQDLWTQRTFWTSQAPKETVTPVSLRAPESIVGHRPTTNAIDVWAAGCLLYEFLTGEALFVVMSFGLTREETDDDHICQLIDVLGPLPEDLKMAWPGLHRWYGPNGEALYPYAEEDGEERFFYPSLETAFDEKKGDDVDKDQADEICKLIRTILRYEPAERSTAAELLKHPWFQE